MSLNKKKSRSLIDVAGIVAFATLISKLFGLIREQSIAAAFGVGPVINAYSYAYVVPGFFLILLGGINGPFHSSLISVLSKRKKTEIAPLVESVTTLVTILLLVITIILILFADTFISILAPGLQGEVKLIAIEQLQIMAPLALLSGLIGIGFGTLNAADQYLLPSISPLFSSVVISFGVWALIWHTGQNINEQENWYLGGMVLAGGTLLGGLLQWLAQLQAQWRKGMGGLRLRFQFNIPGLKDITKILVPATFASGMLHINVYTDLFFASFIPDAAAAMRYANFIVLTPLGIISNMILVPFMPIFSQLTTPENWNELKLRIRQGIFLSALTMLPLTAVFIALAPNIIRVIYQRGAFEVNDAIIVAPVLVAYGTGMFFYLVRDVLVRVFYALGDGGTPFRVSLFNIFLNGLLDFLLYQSFGTPGLVFATILVNLISIFIFLVILDNRLNKLPVKKWIIGILNLVAITFIAALVGWIVNYLLHHIYSADNLGLQCLQLFISSSSILGIFFILSMQLQLPEIELLSNQLKRKLK
ncbi:murein biosynthesis integral membrane protein MurJ [Candidatus Atelocyanobacterium thalassae]|uniref:Probable lipid II flippase MurJ n=1 Tax=cyanobacterium endosymbiont of Braarudosphaera bigelowii TaxID=1285375 RepID=A0ABN6JY39_9CHRO|nr:murein biosynthesis integral membrane protein MurJ [Candidatus Atelocyanobacterium thalassa]BDA39276.1 lipid II flippase MurJ [cyanobacterium endosymbiont of Braarudosphaera bigelowii]